MWYIILGLLSLFYLLLNTIIPQQGALGAYLLRPVLWILLAIACLLLASYKGLSIIRFKRVRRWHLGNNPQHSGLLLGGFQVALLIIVGLFAGFGSSPYAFTPLAILQNIFYVGSFLIGMEISRTFLIKRGTQTKKNTTLTLGLTTLLFVLIQINPTQLTNLLTADTVKILEFIGKTLITSISINLLACYLAYMGGATASMAYVGTLLAFEWFSPILPNPHWTIAALVGTLAPAIGFIILQNSIREPGETKKRHHKKIGIEQGWTAVAVFSVIMIFFSFGYIGVKPTVIYSGSMSPALEVGDIVFIQKVDPATIKPGDIIQYYQYNVFIIHRVISINTTEGTTNFITKGDGNEAPDIEPVPAYLVQGKAQFTIPKLGWVQIFVRNIIRNIGIPI